MKVNDVDEALPGCFEKGKRNGESGRWSDGETRHGDNETGLQKRRQSVGIVNNSNQRLKL